MAIFPYERLLAGLDCNAPATTDAIREFEIRSGIRLPEDYIEFLQYANGGEGFLGKNVYVILWPVEELLHMNEAYGVNKFAPGLLSFGSDGGGNAFAFDMRSGVRRVSSIPFIGMELKAMRPVAESFGRFLIRMSLS
jgi:cell wall assembly regulator SMI1